jgi:phage terminase large subunit-like protein
MHFCAIPNSFPFLVCYTDPSYSSTQKADYKATVLVGFKGGTYYIIKAWVEKCGFGGIVRHHKEARMIAGLTNIYHVIEGGALQEVFLKEIVFPKFTELAPEIPIQRDNRKKPEKFYRIDTTLAPLNENGRLFLNEKEANDKSMNILIEQFKCISRDGKGGHDDAPDAVEGAVDFINKRNHAAAPVWTTEFKRTKNRFA